MNAAEEEESFYNKSTCTVAVRHTQVDLYCNLLLNNITNNIVAEKERWGTRSSTQLTEYVFHQFYAMLFAYYP